MRAHKFRHNYHEYYLAIKNGTYDYSKIYRIFHKHGKPKYRDILFYLSRFVIGFLILILYFTPESSVVFFHPTLFLIISMYAGLIS
jgi:hypothetical protein